MQADESHNKRETQHKSASAYSLVSRQNEKTGSNDNYLVKAKYSRFRVMV